MKNIIFQIKYKNIDNIEDVPIIYNIMKNIIIKENEKNSNKFNYISHFIEQNDVILSSKITWNIVSTIYSVENYDYPIIKEYNHSILLKDYINDQLEKIFINNFFSNLSSENFFEKGIVKKESELIVEKPVNQNLIEQKIDQNLIGKQINQQIDQQNKYINEIMKKNDNEKKEIFFNQNLVNNNDEWKKIERRKKR